MQVLELGTGLLANAGVPLLGTGLWVLIVGTLLVSTLEATLLKRWFAVRPEVIRWGEQAAMARVGMEDEGERWGFMNTWLLIAGNLVSALAGWAFVANARGFQSWILGDRPLERAGFYLILVWALALVVSIAVEWPFFSKAIKDRPLSREGFYVCAGCNVISYGCILAWFSLSGMTTLLTAVKIEPAFVVAEAPYGDVYYLNPDTNEVWRVYSNGAQPQPIGLKVEAGHSLSAERLANGRVKLVEINSEGDRVRSLVDLGDKVAAGYETDSRRDWNTLGRYFGPDEYRKYQVFYGTDGYHGMSVRTPSRIYKLAIDSNPLSWDWNHVTVLPSNQAVAQLGPQVVLVDLETGTVGVLAKGVSPTVVIDR